MRPFLKIDHAGRLVPSTIRDRSRTVLVLKRREGQWVEITHRSGDVLRVRVCDIRRMMGCANLAFDDDARNFEIQRPERHRNADSARTGDPAIPIDPKYYTSLDELDTE